MASPQEHSAKNKRVETKSVEAICGYAEYVLANGSYPPALRNAFGRAVAFQASHRLEELLATASTGVRVGAVLAMAKLNEQLQVLQKFGAWHVPLTIVVTEGGLHQWSSLAQTGSIVYVAHDERSLMHMILAGQVIAEKALRPVVIIAPEELEEKTNWPSYPNALLRKWFGDPDERTDAVSSAQEMVFTKERRRIPNWMSLDHPAMMGAKKDHPSNGLEVASRMLYEDEALQSIIDLTWTEFQEVFEVDFASVLTTGASKPRHVVLTPLLVNGLPDVQDLQTFLKKQKLQLVTLSQLAPVPGVPSLEGKRLESITMIEPMQWQGLQQPLLTAWKAQWDEEVGSWRSGLFAQAIPLQSWSKVLMALMEADSSLAVHYIDVPVTREHAYLPKHEMIIQEVRRRYPSLAAHGAYMETSSAQPTSSQIPESLRERGVGGPPYLRSDHFHDRVAVHRLGEWTEEVADPFQSLSVLPSSSSGMQNAQREVVPVFDPLKCTGCLQCTTSCPHGALPSKGFTIEALLKRTIAQTKATGTPIRVMTSVIKPWAKLANGYAAGRVQWIKSAVEVLSPTFTDASKSIKDPEKKAMLVEEFNALMDMLKGSSLAATPFLFVNEHERSAGDGILFSIQPDPAACVGCGLCEVACPDGAISMLEGEAHESTMLERTRSFWNLPDTEASTLEQLKKQPGLDALSISMMDRKAYQSLMGQLNEMQQPAQALVLRMAMVVMKQAVQGGFASFDVLIGKNLTAIRSGIKKELTDAMPTKNLESLMDVLSEQTEDRLNSAAILQEWGQNEAFKQLNRSSLEQRLQLLEDLQDIRWQLTEGDGGSGRADRVVVLDGSLSAFSVHPWNPFDVPVINSEGMDPAATATGLIHGFERHVLDNIRVLRRSGLVAAKKYDPKKHDAELVGLCWDDLTDEERSLMPTILVFADQRAQSSQELSALHKLLRSGYPVVWVNINDARFSRRAGVAEASAILNGIWPLLVSSDTYVAQTGIADLQHMHDALEGAISYRGGAMVNVLAPDWQNMDMHPSQWTFGCQFAQQLRVALPFVYCPDRRQSVAAQMQLDSNTIAQPWQITELKFMEEGDEQRIEYHLTWADWAFLLSDWKDAFHLEARTEAHVDIVQYLSAEDRLGKIPSVFRVNDKNELTVYRMESDVIAVCEEIQQFLFVFRQWTGLHSDQPERLKEEVMSELQEAFDQERETLKNALTEEKAQWEAEHLMRLKQQVKERLMQLSGHA